MNCYCCGNEITDENRSEEHIINNAFGGHLTSNDLLCKPCNDEFGFGIDADIEGQLGFITDFLGIKRHRENKRKRVRIEMISETGVIKVVGKKMRPLHELSIDTGKKRITLFEEEANYEALKNRKKKELSKEFTVEDREYIKQPDKTRYNVKNSLSDEHGNIGFGGPGFFRAAAKMCLNYYLSNGYDIAYCKDVIAFVTGKKKENDLAYFYYPTHYQIHSLGQEEVSHVIHIVGSTQYKVLYGYIELFSCHNALVIFSLDYQGPEIADTYAYDLIAGTIMEKNVKVRLPRHHLEMMHLIGRNAHAEHLNKFNRLERIIEKRQLL